MFYKKKKNPPSCLFHLRLDKLCHPVEAADFLFWNEAMSRGGRSEAIRRSKEEEEEFFHYYKKKVPAPEVDGPLEGPSLLLEPSDRLQVLHADALHVLHAEHTNNFFKCSELLSIVVNFFNVR